MAYSGFKGIGPRGLGAHKGGNEGAGSVHAFDVSDNSSKKNQRDNFASQDGLNNSPAKQTKGGEISKTEGPTTKGTKEKMPQSGKGPKPKPKSSTPEEQAYGGNKGDESKTKRDYESPAKKNKGMSYDIKEASNQSLSKSARKHYAENAQAANKSGYKG
tara:strand:- start:547 stop:1023 length:477 start_codon:yes stop_codon:yes gene_type:complete